MNAELLAFHGNGFGIGGAEPKSLRNGVFCRVRAAVQKKTGSAPRSCHGAFGKALLSSVGGLAEVHTGRAVFRISLQHMFHVRGRRVRNVPAKQLHGAVAIFAAEFGVAVFQRFANAFQLPEGCALPLRRLCSASLRTRIFFLPVAVSALWLVSLAYSSSCPAHRHAVELYRWHTYTDRHTLSCLAAGANTFVERQVVADHGHIFERLWARCPRAWRPSPAQ